MQNTTLALIQRRLPFLLVLSFLFLYSCKDDKPLNPVDPPKENQYLIESNVIAELTKEQVALKAGVINPLLVAYVKHGIKVYKITYKTKNTDGTDITASGALILPSTADAASMISVQHGTIREDVSAPSNFADGSEAASFGALFGSMGYIISYPDYIGYGASKDLPHPYEHRESLASASLDMLRAAKEFLKEQTAAKWDEKLYIAGYSEGGYATMSLHKMIEEKASSEFDLRASSCGAGAYDKTAFMKYIVNNETHKISSYNALYLWVLLTYDRIYKLDRPTSYYFKEPFAKSIADNGIKAPITGSFDAILNESFKKDLNDGKDTGFTNAIADNDVYNWKPKAPLQLYHGTSDQLVFYFNSEKAFNTMKGLGANVQLIPVPGGDHASSITPYLIGTLAFFTSTK